MSAIFLEMRGLLPAPPEGQRHLPCVSSLLLNTNLPETECFPFTQILYPNIGFSY